MKRNIGKSIAIAFAAMMVVSVAQAQTLIATVPFNFDVNDQHLQAGKYTIDVNAGKVVVLRPISGGGTVLLSNSAGPNDGKRPESCLVFQRYAGSMYLTEIWSASTDEGREIVMSPATTQLAKTQHTEETVIAAALKK